MNPNDLKEKITQHYNSILGREPDDAGLSYYVAQIKNGCLKLNDLPSIFENSDEYRGLNLLKHGCIYTKYGIKMYLNREDKAVSNFLARNLMWEEEETTFLSHTISEGMHIVDIGANIGYYSILFSKWAGKTGKVFSFEPDVDNYRILVKNMAIHKAKNIKAFSKAISNYDGYVTLYQSKTNKGDHRILDFYVNDNDDKRNTIKVDCNRLDSVIPSNQNVDFIKMDIQGAEMLALEGMKNILERNRKISILLEFWPYAIQNSGFSPRELIEKIHQLGFSIFTLEGGQKSPVSTNYSLIHSYSHVDNINLYCERIS